MVTWSQFWHLATQLHIWPFVVSLGHVTVFYNSFAENWHLLLFFWRNCATVNKWVPLKTALFPPNCCIQLTTLKKDCEIRSVTWLTHFTVTMIKDCNSRITCVLIYLFLDFFPLKLPPSFVFNSDTSASQTLFSLSKFILLPGNEKHCIIYLRRREKLMKTIIPEVMNSYSKAAENSIIKQSLLNLMIIYMP